MAGFWGYGVELRYRQDGTTGAWVSVGSLTGEVPTPETSVSEIDVTAHDGDGWAEFVPGLRDAGTLSLNILFNGADPIHTQLRTDAASGTTNREWQIILPDPARTTVVFTGYVSTFNVTSPQDGAIQAAFGIRVSGEPTWTYNGADA